MEIEMKEFYPTPIDPEKETIAGRLKVYISSLGFTLSGIQVQCLKDGTWRYRMPASAGIHHLTKRVSYFPLITFDDSTVEAEILFELKKLAPEFVKKRVAQGCISSIKQKRDFALSNGIPKPENAAAGLEQATTLIPKPASQWQDPPKRKIGVR